MHTPFSVVVSRFLRLSALATEEAKYAQNLILPSGVKVIAVDGDMRTLIGEPKPCRAAMKAFLKELPLSALYALVALLYTGRHDEADPADYWDRIRENFDTADSAIDVLVKNTVRNVHIEAAIKKLTGSDLDEIPKRIEKIAP
jgi:hypothetical protein